MEFNKDRARSRNIRTSRETKERLALVSNNQLSNQINTLHKYIDLCLVDVHLPLDHVVLLLSILQPPF